ncbi:SusC/RagA family TonB-linked outer membrane protein [Flavicella sp.]|uniref:SusC/RagA family TonB-linked outer membrane protein n=1 Tax=Flavicella sp. TaxID=2957742 RepID=UPI00301B55C5
MKKNTNCAFLILFLTVSNLLAQNSTSSITGVVQDAEIPLPGATILIKNTQKGTTTDFDGIFEITNVESGNYELLITFIGYDEKSIVIEVPFDKELNLGIINLNASLESLDEVVVVTALGIKRQEKKIGYSTQKMDVSIIENIVVPNTANLFSGQVAGLTISNPTGLFQSANIQLRGGSPIIVIDDVIVDTDFYDLSPNDIGSINVLKGQTAAALYGSRGKDGAILITTKNAKVNGLEITLNHSTMVSAGFTVFPETQTEYGNGSNGKYEFWDGKDGGISDGDMIWGPKFEHGVLVAQWNSPILDNVTGETIPWWGDVEGTQYNDKSRYSRVATPWEYHNNLETFLGTGYISSTDFSIQQKNEMGTLRLTANYNHQEGRVPNSSINTGGITFKSSTNLSDKLILDTKLAYNKVFSPNYPRHGYGPNNHMYTILIWMGDDVNGQDLKDYMYIPGQEGYRQANFNYAWYNNPYFAAYELNQKYDANLINAQMRLNYKFNDNFNIQLRGSSVLKDRFEDRETPKTYLNYGDSRDGDYKTWNKKDLTVDYDILAHYNKDINKNFSIDVNAGASTYYNKYNEEYNATDGLIVPFNYSLNNTKGNVDASTYVREEATESIYATVGIDLFDTVFLNFTGRNDWNSTLPKENRSYFYPSTSISTLVSNLITMPNVITYLKVKASWAKVSGALEPYQISSYYDKNGNFDGSIRLEYPNYLINPNIEPESKSTFEIGFSTGLLSNRLGLDFTYYNELSSNQIIDLPISVASGFENRKVNGNEYTRQGYEIVLNASPYKTEKFNWNVMLNWSASVKKITAIYDNAENLGNYRLNDRLDTYFATTWQKSVDGGLVINENGLPIKNNFESNLGHSDPNWTLGLQNTFKFNNFTVGIGIDGVWGGLIRSKTVEKMWWGGKHPNSTEYRDAEYDAGVPVYVPKGVNILSGQVSYDTFGEIISDTRVYKKNTTAVNWQSWSQTYPYQAAILDSDDKKFANIFDRSFFKLRSVSVNYDFTKMLKPYAIKNLSVTLSGYNLLIWKKADIIDPDFGNDDNLQDPSTRWVGLGVSMKF